MIESVLNLNKSFIYSNQYKLVLSLFCTKSLVIFLVILLNSTFRFFRKPFHCCNIFLLVITHESHTFVLIQLWKCGKSETGCAIVWMFIFTMRLLLLKGTYCWKIFFLNIITYYKIRISILWKYIVSQYGIQVDYKKKQGVLTQTLIVRKWKKIALNEKSRMLYWIL